MVHDMQESLFVPKQEALEPTEEDDVSSASASSSEEEDDDEFEVEMVLAERPDPNSPTTSQYLIKWENYPMDQCTWEPLQNLGEGVLQGWEETKIEIKNGTREAFDLTHYEEALKAAEDLERRRMGVEDTSGEDSDCFDNKGTTKSARDSLYGSASRSEGRQQIFPSAHSHSRPGPNQSAGKSAGAAAKSTSEKRTGNTHAQNAPQSAPRYHGTARAARPQSAGSPTTKTAGISGRPKPAAAPGSATHHQSSSLRDKFQGKKAKRSGVPRTAPRIVMPGEQVHKSRRRLEDTMIDPSKDPKRFHSMRVMNIARKRAIERSDQAPRNVSAIPAHFLLSNDRIAPALGKSDSAKNTNASTEKADQPVPKRPKKAVRFSGADDSSSAEDVTVESPPQMMEIDEHPTSKKGISLSTYKTRPRVTNVTKECTFGPGGSASVSVEFTDVPKSSEPWIATFHSAKSITLDRECRLDDFTLQRTALVFGPTLVGFMQATSADEQQLLTNVAANLTYEGTALQLFQLHYCMLVFPCSEPRWLGTLGRPASSDKTDAVLQFLLFKPSFDPQSFPTSRLAAPEETATPEPDLARMFKDIFCLDSRPLRPRDPVEKRGQCYMLCFSTENLLLCQMVALWLRTMQPGCRIYIYTHAGAWKSFMKELATSPGALIFDEILSPRIRRFPGIWRMIDSVKCCTFWCLSTGESTNPPRFPSNEDALLAPSQYHFTQLFPHGNVYFLTPSFVLSDPQGLCDFLEYFTEWGANLGFMVVASHDFLPWMHDVANEQASRFEQEADIAPSDLFTEKILKSAGERKEDLMLRRKAISLWHAIMDRYGDEQASENIRKIEWAPRQIHACDEQSLLNWFCWWSLKRLDRHRRFIIIGSNLPRGAPCRVEFDIPNYPEDMTADPDAEEQETEKVIAFQRNAQINAWQQIHPDATARTIGSFDSSPPPGDCAFVGDIIRGDSADDISAWLCKLEPQLSGGWTRTMTRPVAYMDRDMADQFDDTQCAAATFKQWLYGPRPFTKWLNTWFGLFYTVDGTWSGKPKENYRKRPWIAVYRPMNPHFGAQNYAAMELLIWDVAASKGALEEAELRHLPEMQAQLVEFVLKEAPHGDVSQYYLKRVWIGNMLSEAVDTSRHPLEVACQQLDVMTKDARIWLPPWDLKLIERGWVQLKSLKRNPASSAPTLTHGELIRMPFPKAPIDYESPEHIIFHPLRSQAAERRAHLRPPSRCCNDMYEAAIEARLRDPECRTAVLRYKPTSHWHADMMDEKRDASHVRVHTWPYLWAELKKKIAYKSAQKASARS